MLPLQCNVGPNKKDTNWLEKSCAVVCDERHNVFGIISESDILEIEKSQKNLKATQAWEECSHQVLSVAPDSDIKEVMNLMLKNNIHHVLVLNKSNGDNKFNGIISSLDIIKILYDKT